MIIINEKVQHISFGIGVITDAKDNKIWVQFEEKFGIKIFQYPEAFEKFLKAVNSITEDNVLEELHVRQEQLEMERKEEKERKAAELEENKSKLEAQKKKSPAKSRKKKV